MGRQPEPQKPFDGASYDVVVVGAGFSGIYMLHRLLQMGLKALVVDAASGIGGTWFWNRYPGARCDVESLEYSYSFSNEIEQEWRWSHRYAKQSEIRDYLNYVVDKLELRPHIALETKVVSQTFDERDATWVIVLANGTRLKSQYCVMATGNLSIPRIPEFPGLDDFQGRSFHSALWPEKPVDFTGKKVGLIGTGATGIQIAPIVAKQAAHLTVFQRTANFSLPARDAPLEDATDRSFRSRYTEHRAKARQSFFGISNVPTPTQSALDVSDARRNELYEERWQQGGHPAFLSLFNDLGTNEKSNETAADFIRRKIRETVRDPRTAALLEPHDHPIGAKRACADTDYYETFNRANVTLVDVRSDPIERLTRTGLKTKSQEYELDAVIFATGFDAMTGALNDIDIVGKGGLSLRTKWANGPVNYLGLMVADFPNLFIVTGPGSPSVKSNMALSIEQHVEWIADCLKYAMERGHRRIEAGRPDEQRWVEHVDTVAHGTLFPRADSWYNGSNVPGKPRMFMPYVGGVAAYRKICDEVVAAGYRGIDFGA